MKKIGVQSVSKIIPLTLSVAIISVMMCLTIMAAWIPPGQTPPGGNVAAPINTSGNAQGKLGNLGIGTTDPEAKLDIAAGNLDLDGTANTNQFGIITKNGTPFIHNFNYGYNGTITTAGKNTFVGLNAGNLTMGSTASQTYHSSSNTGVGANALFSNTTGYANSAFGTSALYFNAAGYNNVALGMNALYFNAAGYNNVALGVNALYFNAAGYNNVALSMGALFSNTAGYNNVAVGTNALNSNTTGYANSAFGTSALYSNTTGYANSAFGSSALNYNTTGNYNLGLGYKAGENLTSGSGNIIIGYDIDAPSATADNQLNIGNLIFATGLDGRDATLSTGNIGIGTTNPGAKLEVAGQLKVTGGSPGLGKVLTSDSDGLASWQNAGGVSGGGTNNYVPKFSNSTSLGNSQIYDNGSSVGVGTNAPVAGQKVTVAGNVGITGWLATNGTIGADGVISSNTGISTEGHLVASGYIATNGTIGADGVISSNTGISTKGYLVTSGYIAATGDISTTNGNFIGNKNITIGGQGYKPGGGSWAATSDSRLKKNIAPLTGAIEKISRLQGVNFEWVNPEEHGGDYSLQGGFIAQDVEKMFPGWIEKTEVTGADKNLIPGQALSVSLPFEYDALVVEAIKEQQRQIAGQQQQIREQQKQIDELRAQMEKILSDR